MKNERTILEMEKKLIELKEKLFSYEDKILKLKGKTDCRYYTCEETETLIEEKIKKAFDTHYAEEEK